MAGSQYPQTTRSLLKTGLLLEKGSHFHLRSDVILLTIVFLFFLGFCFIACTRSHGKWKEGSQSVFHSFQKRGGRCRFLRLPCIVVLSVGGLVVATFSVEMSESSEFSSQSRVQVEVAKSWPCSTGSDPLANFLFSIPSFPHPAPLSSKAGSGWISTSSVAFCPSEDF